MTHETNTTQNTSLKVTVLGGTGFVGRHLCEVLQTYGYEVNAFGRQAFATTNSLVEAINGSDYLIVLVGENIGKRWSESYKQALFDSRINNNQLIRQALHACEHPPSKIFSTSAIGIYPENSCENTLDEACEEIGEGFLGQLGKAWEESSKQLSPTPVIMRFGVVLGKDGGALEKMLLPFKLGLGGPVAGGKQCFSWVHIDDLTQAIVFLMNNAQPGDVYNITSPNPVTNAEFGKTLANQLNRPFLIPLPEWQLKLMFGEGAQVLTHSSAVIPTKLQSLGFEFKYPTAQKALSNLL